MATIVDVLRAGQGARRAGNRRQRWDQFSQDMAGQSPVVGTGGTPASVGGVNITIPGQQAVNWGGVLGGAASNFMGARAQRDEERLMEQKEMLSNELMRSTFENDPEGMRLIQAYQAGVPGAEQAVQAHLAPKKEALGAFLQYIQSGVADEEAAAAMAERYGISPEVGRKMASTAVGRAKSLRDEERNWNLNADLLKQENLYALKGAQGASVTGDGQRALTPGEKQTRAKMMDALDKELMAAGVSDTKFQEVMSTIERDDAFGPASKLSEFLAESPNRALAAVGKNMQSEGQLKLKEYLTSETLRRMAMLGGNDSNEELNRITASLPSAMNDKQAAMAMLNSLHQWEKITRMAVKMRRDDIQSGAWFNNQPGPDDYYRKAKAAVTGGQSYTPTPGAPAGIPTEQLNSIEMMLDDLGLQ